MTPAIHKTFTIERTYQASPERVFRAHSDPEKKRRWFAEGEGFVIDSYTLDFREGGFERTRFRFGEDGPPMTNDCIYFDIVPDRRLVFAYHMTFGGAPLERLRYRTGPRYGRNAQLVGSVIARCTCSSARYWPAIAVTALRSDQRPLASS